MDSAAALHEDDLDLREIRLDSDRKSPLVRVHFAEGMLLGIEATNAEQEFHRRRLVRHQHWLHGAGTVLGLAVSLHQRQPPAVPQGQVRPDVHVSPGVAVDGLGREVQCSEPYCMDLVDWIVAQGDDPKAGKFEAGGLFHLRNWLEDHGGPLVQGYFPDDDVLHLRVTARQEACPRGLQPVFAHRLNDSTDAVDASRVGDGVQLELLPDEHPEDDFHGGPQLWADVTVPEDADLNTSLTAAELALLKGKAASNALRRRARLLYATSLGLPDGGGTGTLPSVLFASAQILLARISIPVPDVKDLVIDPAQIQVTNLVRPFAIAEELLPTA